MLGPFLAGTQRPDLIIIDDLKDPDNWFKKVKGKLKIFQTSTPKSKKDLGFFGNSPLYKYIKEDRYRINRIKKLLNIDYNKEQKEIAKQKMIESDRLFWERHERHK